MLSILAKIAAQLEQDGHQDLADQADEIITAIANRDSHSYEDGAIWQELVDESEPNEAEEVEESGLSIHEDSTDLGMVADETYSSVLAEHGDAFKRYIGSHELTRQMAGTQGQRNSPVVPNDYIEEMVEELRAIFDELAARGGKKVSWDPEFDETARRLVEEAATESMAVVV